MIKQSINKLLVEENMYVNPTDMMLLVVRHWLPRRKTCSGTQTKVTHRGCCKGYKRMLSSKGIEHFVALTRGSCRTSVPEYQYQSTRVLSLYNLGTTDETACPFPTLLTPLVVLFLSWSDIRQMNCSVQNTAGPTRPPETWEWEPTCFVRSIVFGA
jgi:hypothetical protein